MIRSPLRRNDKKEARRCQAKLTFTTKKKIPPPTHSFQVAFFTSDKTLAGPQTLECVRKAAVSQDWFFSEWKEYYVEMANWGVDKSVLKGLSKSTGK
jgi:hypothetical protein